MQRLVLNVLPLPANNASLHSTAWEGDIMEQEIQATLGNLWTRLVMDRRSLKPGQQRQRLL
jgi:hypothetical protein